MKKLFLKIASGVFAASLMFSAAATVIKPVSPVSAGAATVRTDVSSQGNTIYTDDIEWLEIEDRVNTSTVSTDWSRADGVTSIQTPDVLKYKFGYRQALITKDSYNANGIDSDGNPYNYAIVVEFDMMLNNVEGANFGFIYGAETHAYGATLDMQATTAPCLSMYGVNSMFYSTLEDDSLIYNNKGERPENNRWLDWDRSAKTTLYIHPDGSQEMYQDDKLVAYVTEKDIAQMDADAAAKGLITAGQLIARSKDLNGRMGFGYRPSENDDATVDTTKTMDFTLGYLNIGYINESWFTTAKSYQMVDGREVLTINDTQLPTNPFPTSATDDQGKNIWWRITDNVAPEGGGWGPYFMFHDSLSQNISNTQVAWIKATQGDYGYYTTGATSLVTELSLPNVDARLYDQRYAMLRMRTWLGGLNSGEFSITMGQYKLLIKQATEMLPSGYESTRYFMYMYDGDKRLKNIDEGDYFGYEYIPIKIYDNALLALSVWGDGDMSVSYGGEGNLAEFAFTGGVSETLSQKPSGLTRGNIMIETTASNARCFYDDFFVYTFDPYMGEDFTGGSYDSTRVQVNGDYATVNSTTGMVDFDTPLTSESAVVLSPYWHTNFTLEFDSPYRTATKDQNGNLVKSSWLGVVMGMDSSSTQHFGDYNLAQGNYRGNNNLFLLINSSGAVHLWTGISGATSYISDGVGGTQAYVPMLIPVDENNDDKWPAAKPWDTLAEVNSYTEIGCADMNIHFKIVVQDNVLTMYHQIGDYEMVKTFESVVLGTDAFGNLKNAGYVSIQATSNAGFAIDNVKVTENKVKPSAINTFLDVDGELYQATSSRLSESTALTDAVPASEILPVGHPEKPGYTFIGWVDAKTGYLISESMSFINFGGRIFKPAYVGLYGNTLTAGGAIALNYYVSLDEGAQKAQYFVAEFTEEGKDPIEINSKSNAATAAIQRSGEYTISFSMDVSAKDYRRNIRFRVRVGDTFYSLGTAWDAYSVGLYLDQLAAENEQGSGKRNIALAMELYCEMARQYFDPNVTDPTDPKYADVNAHAYLWNITSDVNKDNDIAYEPSAEYENLLPYAIIPIANSDGMTGGAIPAGMKDWIRPMNFTVVFESTTDLRFNFQYRDGNGWYMYKKNPDLKFYWGGANATEELDERYIACRGKGTNGTPYYYLQVPDIAAKDLFGLHQFTIKYGEHWVTMQMSALGYALGCIQEYEAAAAAGKATSEQAKLAWLGKAMYVYAQAAYAYFA